ncbi:hypothetical protein COLO4_16154 [Corchorus olitorius]|uniref:Uncharacterized protein n=1 Tax=Corchorus olitorius TaxID=93759 RepID=A0A1R3JJ27_9ROSI|nr:hypothetical protein COLO4_16154 [Corchorus olitorius]
MKRQRKKTQTAPFRPFLDSEPPRNLKQDLCMCGLVREIACVRSERLCV